MSLPMGGVRSDASTKEVSPSNRVFLCDLPWKPRNPDSRCRTADGKQKLQWFEFHSQEVSEVQLIKANTVSPTALGNVNENSTCRSLLRILKSSTLEKAHRIGQCASRNV